MIDKILIPPHKDCHRVEDETYDDEEMSLEEFKEGMEPYVEAGEEEIDAESTMEL